MKNFRDVFSKYLPTSNADYNREAAYVAEIPGLKKFWDYFWSYELPTSEEDGIIAAGCTAAAFAVSHAQTPMHAFLAWLSLECGAAKMYDVYAELHDYAAFCESSGDAVDLCMVNDAYNLMMRLVDEGFKIPADIVVDVMDSFRSFKPSHRYNTNELDYIGHWYTLWELGRDCSHPGMRLKRYKTAELREAWETGAKRAQAEITGPLQVDHVNGFTRIFSRGYDIKIRRLEHEQDDKVFFVIDAKNYGEDMDPKEFGVGPAPFVVTYSGHDKLYYISKPVDRPTAYRCYIYGTGQEIEFTI